MSQAVLFLIARFSVLLLACLLAGCGITDVKRIGKGDIDMVADSHRKITDDLIYQLMVKLYKRNPRELAKHDEPVIDVQVSRLKQMVVKGQPLLIDGDEDVVILQKGFDEAFEGDRVYQLMAGLLSMVHKSYGYRSDFYLFDQLDQQKLYHAARNLEVFAWRLRTSTGADGALLLLSVQLGGPVVNLSFERLLGKMIALQDMMALVAADGDTRAIKGVAQGLVRMVFLPI